MGEPIPILYVQMDGTGIPVVKKETLGRKGKTEGQPAHTREVKLGCVFTQTGWDEEGYAIRDLDSTTYTGAIETAEEFGKRIYLEAWNRGWSRAEKKVVMGDGAEWIWNLAEPYFPGAIQIVDLYHARQHLWELARLLHPNDHVNPGSLDQVPPATSARQGQDRKAHGCASRHSHLQSRTRREGSHRGRLLREKRRTDALPNVSPPTPVCWFGRDRGWLQNRDRFSPQAVRNVLDCAGSQRYHRLALLPSQRPLRGLLGVAARPLNLHFHVVRPL